MRLKNVEIYGFKSFAEKSKLLFEKDVCAIVGPNGSGKSNISDAIRWVLGEQSAKSLRGSNMQDIIFSGTETKKQMNMAQVSMTLDNKDKALDIEFDEVNVTRKVYRTGESEYLLNNSQVRLKDIKELFLDTGIGKDGYSIIGQGRIDDILSGRSEDRRYIFEEASGIAKFKYKKTEAERKLVKNEDSLSEIKSELKIKEQEVALLETQANNAKEGMKLTSALEKMELSMLQQNLDKLDNDIVKYNSDKEYLTSDLNEKNKRLYFLNEKILPVTKEIDELKIKLEDLKTSAIEKDKNIVNYKAEIKLLEEKIKYSENDLSRIDADIKNRYEKIEANNTKVKEQELKYQNLIDEKEKLNDKISSQIDEKDKVFDDKVKLDNDIKLLENKTSSLRDNISKLNIDKSTKENLDRSNIIKLEEYKANLTISYKDLDRHNNELKIKEEALSDIETKLVHQAKVLEEMLEYRSNLQNDIKVKKDKLQKLNNEYLQLKSQRDVLYSVYSSYEGFYKPIQNLLKIRDKNSEVKEKIVGVLADLIEVDKKYRQAVDVTLSGSLQNIVVSDENDAKYLIELIKRQNIGRITFLPISKINGNSVNVSHPLVIDTLNNLISYDENIKGIVDHFLGRTVLVEDMNSAIQVSRDLKGLRIVTLEGEIINSWGSMVGGNLYKKETHSLLNRKKEISKLDESIKSISITGQKQAEELKKTEARFETLINDLNDIDNKNNSLSRDKSNLISDIKELKVKIDFNAKSTNEFEQLITKMNLELETIDFTNIDKLEKELIEENKLLEQKKNESNLISETLINFEKDEIKNKSLLEVLIRDINFVKDNIEETKLEIENLQALIKTGNLAIKEVEKEVSLSQTKLKHLNDKLSYSENMQITEADDIISLTNRIKSSEEDIFKDSKELDELREFVNDTDKKLFQINLKLENESEKRKELISNFIETYDLTENDLDVKLRNLEPIKVTRKEILEVRNKLNQIGFFNYATIDQFAVENENLIFIKKQYEDLVETREDIIKMIKKLEHDMVVLFKESFKKINDKFSEVFSILFDGGQAQLILDSDDVLTAGIEIIAKPPGKKLKNLGLLSGGEKALTAVALLFAIFEINPAPFCILDEIDAALDEANIKRYINYLKSMTDKTQFVIITHRKITMEMADILYGVTMEEKGISKVITLALDNYKEE